MFYLFDDIINIKNLDLNNIKIDVKPYKTILIHYVGYETPNSIKRLYFIISNANGYIEESNGDKYLTIIPIDESKGKLEKYEKIWSKMKYLIGSANNN